MRSTRRWAAILACAAILVASCSSDPSTEDAAADDPSGQTVDERPGDDADGNRAESDLDTGGESGPRVKEPFQAGFPPPMPPDPDPTPLDIDDDTRRGVLPNGLTYYVRSNDSPGRSVSLRLVVRAGGLQEDPRGTGVAHFLEHMLFNGTERFPGNALDAALRSIGAEIGPDFNAYTSDTETVYQLAIADNGDNVDVAFDVLSEWAAAATIDPREVRAEAPIVREEQRLRDESGEGIVLRAFEEAYFEGTPFAGVNVSGTEETIAATTSEVLRTFYDTWYRPDNMAVIAVGDRSLDDLERLITERFADLEPRGQVIPAETPSSFPLRRDPFVDVVIEPSYGDSFISVDIPFPHWDQNTRGGNELVLTEIVLGLMINDRIEEGVATGRLDLRRGWGGWFAHNRYLQYMGFNVDADDLEAGTEVLMTELRGSIQNGFTRAELDRAIEIYRSVEEQRLATAGSLQDTDFADLFVEHFLSGADLQSVEESVEMNLAILSSLDLDAVNNHWRWSMTNAAPIVLVVGPDADRTGDAADHLAAVERAATADVAAIDDAVVEIDALMERPEPVREIDRRGLVRRSGTELVFGNGMRVLFSPSDIAEGEVALVSESPGGRVMLSADDGALAPVAAAAVGASGLGPHSAVQVRRFLGDLDVGLGPYVADTSEGFSGGASRDDVEVLFQLLHLLVTAPAVEEIPFRQQIEFFRDLTVEAGLDSALAADVAVSDARTGGGALAAVPALGQLDAFTPDDALSLYRSRFLHLDDHVVVVVGDVPEGVVVDLARTYIGSLPGRDEIERPDPRDPPGPLSIDLEIGSGTTAGAYRLLTSAEADETIENRVLAELATSLLNDRAFTILREQLGATYGGLAVIEFEEPGDGVELLVSIDGDPGRIDEIASTVSSELDALATGRIGDDDFAEAVAVLESRYNFVNNGFVIESLFDEARLPDAQVIDRDRQQAALARIDRADLAVFLDTLLSTDDRIEVRNVPVG